MNKNKKGVMDIALKEYIPLSHDLKVHAVALVQSGEVAQVFTCHIYDADHIISASQLLSAMVSDTPPGLTNLWLQQIFEAQEAQVYLINNVNASILKWEGVSE